VSRPTDTKSALTFRLALRRYALSLRGTSGVQDLGAVRRIPDAPWPWLGLADWGGRVLNVIDLPNVLEDAAIEPVKSLVRLHEPHDGIAVFIPARLGLCELTPPRDPAGAALYTALRGGKDALHWIHLDAIMEACSVAASA